MSEEYIFTDENGNSPSPRKAQYYKHYNNRVS